MGVNTHTEFGHDPELGTYFLSGVPDTCKHNYVDPYFRTAKGRDIFWYTFPRLRKVPHNSPEFGLILREILKGLDDQIVFGSSQCRKCKKYITEYDLMREAFMLE